LSGSFEEVPCKLRKHNEVGFVFGSTLRIR